MAAALRVALGAEVQQFAANVLRVYREVLQLFPSGSRDHTIAEFQKIVRFPKPVVFPNSVENLGLLGKYTCEIVYFFNQVATVCDKMEHIWQDSQISADSVALSLEQSLNLADSLLQAAETAVRTLPAFAGTPRSEHDAAFVAAVTDERQKFGTLVNSYQSAATELLRRR